MSQNFSLQGSNGNQKYYLELLNNNGYNVQPNGAYLPNSIYDMTQFNNATQPNSLFASQVQSSAPSTQELLGPTAIFLPNAGNTQASSSGSTTGYTYERPGGSSSTSSNTNVSNTGYTYSDNSTQGSQNNKDKTLSADDIRQLVDAGVYDSIDDAIDALKADGYRLSDDAEVELGLYSAEDEEKIQTMMDTLGISREEAVKRLGDKVKQVNDRDAIEAKYDNLIESGFSHREAIEYLEELGYEVPEDMKATPKVYSEEDEARIKALMDSTGCSKEEAVKILGCKEQKPGLLTRLCTGVANVFKGIGNGIKNAWNSFWNWLI